MGHPGARVEVHFAQAIVLLVAGREDFTNPIGQELDGAQLRLGIPALTPPAHHIGPDHVAAYAGVHILQEQPFPWIVWPRSSASASRTFGKGIAQRLGQSTAPALEPLRKELLVAKYRYPQMGEPINSTEHDTRVPSLRKIDRT